ncbi:glycosyltransferase [Ideonella sp. DXS22W]|uniref:Glycosyltransferase n=1 Tax=Pseudaquabacterium inlustre TaxID=2984192 RepID=A0ABU9CDC7_9BURK
MNILVVGKFYTEGFARHIAETLTDLGHAVRRFEPGLRSKPARSRLQHRLHQVRNVLYESTDSLPAVRARRMATLWDCADEAPLDVVIVAYDFLWPAEVAELKRRTGAAVALWYPDAITNFSRAFFMNAAYDGLFFKDPFTLHALGDVLASPVHYLPECFNPARHWLPDDRIGSDPVYACDITTAGNLHSWRVACFKHLVDYDVKIWGNPAPLWMAAGAVSGMHQGRGVYNEDKVRAFRGAKIVLNNLHYGEIWGVNVRCFEAAGAGAFQMVDARPSLIDLFEDGREIVSFRGMSDLRRQIDHWLPRGDERRAIADAGMRRAHAEHTYAHRLQVLIDTLGGRTKGHPVPGIEVRRRAH